MTPFQKKQLALMRQMETMLAADSHVSTIVPMQADYATDNQMCLSLNAFVPEAIATSIHNKLIEPLQRLDRHHYYYQNESLHVTFHSIRIIHNPPTYSQKDIETSRALLTKLIPSERPFPFVWHGVLALPTSVSVIVLVTPSYNRFIRRVRHEFVSHGIPDDKKYFSDTMVFANTTICRYTHKPSPEFIEKLQTLKDTNIGNGVIDTVSLVETNAGAHPSKTRVLGDYRFAGN